MTKENLISINVIIDSSGSMAHLANDTIGSFNTFLKEQKEYPGEALFTLCTFSSDYHLVHDNEKINNVADLDVHTYRPMGSTALLDAMGATIDSVGVKLNSLPEEERASKVIFLIITDGHENASRNFTAAQIRDKVKHQEDVYNWNFIFMGSNIDAIAAGVNLGISMNNTLNYDATAAGTEKLYSTISSNVSSYRGSNAAKVDFFNQTNQGLGTPKIK